MMFRIKTTLSLAIFVLLCVLFSFLMTGCGLTKAATVSGEKISKTFVEQAEIGTQAADESASSWPYVSGLIKGIFADNYELDMPMQAKNIIKKLDELAAKKESGETLTTEEKGFILGSYLRLEEIATKEAWDRYGTSLVSAIKKMIM